MNTTSLSHAAHSELPVPALAERTLPKMLQRQATLHADSPLLTIGGVRWTHSDATRAAGVRAALLRQAGVEPGDRVAVMCGNRIEAIEMLVGCGWLGAVTVPINTASKAIQLGYVLANCRACLLVIEASFLTVLEQIDLSTTSLREVWILDGDDLVATAPGNHFKDARFAVRHYPQGTEEALPADVQASDTLAILYTSGTTGPAKGVLCTHGHYYLFGLYSANMLGVVPEDVLFTTLPLFHINALNTFAQASILGAHAVVEPKFSVSGFWQKAQSCGATVVYLLGAMVPMLLAQPAGSAERSHRVRVGLGGGAPATAADQFQQRTGVVLVDGYASTETSVVISAPPGRRGQGSMGWLRPGFQARVADALDQPVPHGEAGELLLRAEEPFAFANGYFGMPDKTVEAWRNLWFHTGDRVIQEPDGSFRFIDRMKDAIRRRGENISSYEVEQALLAHPHVAQAAAYPVHSELAEDEVMVSLVPKQGIELNLLELAAHCEQILPYFAVPRFFRVTDELPRTENGKVQKFRLRDVGIAPGTWERPGATRRRSQGAT